MRYINVDFIPAKGCVRFLDKESMFEDGFQQGFEPPPPAPTQVEDVGFSLSHPNQYFVESQKILGGGKDPKREADAPQRSQENVAARAARGPTASSTGDGAEMTEDLDSFFQDG